MPNLTVAFPTPLHLFSSSSSTFLHHHGPFLFPVHKPSFEAIFVPLISFLSFDFFLLFLDFKSVAYGKYGVILTSWVVGRSVWSLVLRTDSGKNVCY